MMKEYYTMTQIAAQFDSLESNEKLKILYSALSHMEKYNGRSKFECIALAMGYTNYEGKNDTYEKYEDC